MCVYAASFVSALSLSVAKQGCMGFLVRSALGGSMDGVRRQSTWHPLGWHGQEPMWD